MTKMDGLSAPGRRHRHAQAELPALTRRQDGHPGLAAKIAIKALRIVEALPRFDRQKRRTGLLPDAEMEGVGKVEAQRRAVFAREHEGAALQPVPDQRIALEQRSIGRKD